MQEVFNSNLKADAIAQLALTGARSIALAAQVIAFIEDFKRSQPEYAPHLESLCRSVIRDWGLDMSEPAPPTVRKTDEEEPVLRWPPPEPALPDVFMENFYTARVAVTGEALFADDDSIELQPETLLRFTGSAHWSTPARCWMFRMIRDGDPGQLTTWVRSTMLKPGDEIPKEKP